MPTYEPTALCIVDDEDLLRRSLIAVLESADYAVSEFASGVDFLKALPDQNPACIVLDVQMPQMSGLDVLEILKQNRPEIPVIMMSGFADVSMAVKAMQSGASDFVEKPFQVEDVLETVRRVIDASASQPIPAENAEAQSRVAKLSNREREVLALLIEGKQNKVVARELGISPRTVEVHRARIMQRLNVESFAELVRLSVLSDMTAG